MRLLHRVSIISACAGTALTVALLPAAGGADPAAARASASAAGDRPSRLARDLAAVRRATARFRDVERAQAAGYQPAGPCVTVPGQGTMGVHYVKRSLLADPAVDLRRPEALLYVPSRGGMRLVGVEYVRADADGDTATADDRPRLFGRGFHGPMAGHGPGEPVHYDLHVWVWAKNPRGTFALFNPRVTC